MGICNMRDGRRHVTCCCLSWTCCRKLEEDVSLLQMQLHQRDGELIQLQQQVRALTHQAIYCTACVQCVMSTQHVLAAVAAALLGDGIYVETIAVPGQASWFQQLCCCRGLFDP